MNKFTLTMLLVASMFSTDAFSQMKLIASTHQMYDGTADVTQDSVLYFYSGTKGLKPKFPIPEFYYGADSLWRFKLNNGKLEMTDREIYYYKNNDVDSVVTYSLSNNTWSVSDKRTLHYTGGKPDTVVNYNLWKGSLILSSRIVYEWNGNEVKTATTQNYSFGGKGKPASWNNKRQEETSVSGTTTTVTYRNWKSGGGSGSWSDSAQIATKYVGSNIDNIVYSKDQGGTLTETNRTFYVYDGSSRIESIKSDLYTGSAWESDDSVLYYYTGANKSPDSINSYVFQFGNYVPSEKHVLTHNSADQKVKDRVERFNGTSYAYSANDTTNNWYYGWNVSVENIPGKAENIRVYPSPTSDKLNIVLGAIGADKSLNFAIVNMEGRTLRSWTAANQTNITISVNDLPTGNYVLNINDGTESMTKRFVVTH